MKRTKWRKLFTVCVIALTLTGCGKAEPLPTAYTVGEDSLPALSEVLELGTDISFSSQENDDGTVTYQYQDLSSGTEAVQTYLQDLSDSYECTLLDESGQRVSTESISAKADGHVVAARESATGQGLFELDVNWDETSCTVTPMLAVDAELPAEETMTLEEAVAYLQSLPPKALGLDGESMSEYDIFAEDGIILLDDEVALCLNVYDRQTHQHQASYLIAGSSYQIYRLDRETGEAVLLSP